MSCPSHSYFDSRFIFDKGRRRVWKAIVEYLQHAAIGDSGTVLEIGPGYGDFINQVQAKRKIAVDILDVSPYLNPGIEFHQADGTDLSFINSNQIDTIFGSNVLEHFSRETIFDTLQEYHRVLKADGRLILIQPNFRLCYARYFDDYTHQTIFTDESLCGILQANGFQIILRRNRFLPFSMYSRLPKSYILTKLYLSIGIPIMAKQMLIVGQKSRHTCFGKKESV
jgi:SAM-dependent methyltransferase